METSFKKANEFSNWQDSYNYLLKVHDSTNETVLGLIKSIKTSNDGISGYIEFNDDKVETLSKLCVEQNKTLQKFIGDIGTGINDLYNKLYELSNMCNQQNKLIDSHNKLLDFLGKELKETKDELNRLKEIVKNN